MKYEIGAMVEAKSGSLTNWYEGQIVGYDDTNDIYVLHMCEEYPFTPYAGFSEDRIREVSGPTVIHVVINSSSPVADLNHMREKMGREPLSEIDTKQFEQNLEDAQIEAKAEELYKIYTDEYNSRFSNVLSIEWSLVSHEFPFHDRFRAMARHLATPQSDVQHALQAALESECELMDILRKIGKVFGKNVGTDIGILDLPKLVEGEVEDLRALNETLTLGRDNLFRWRNQLQCDLVDLIVEKKKCPRPRPGDHWGDDKILAELRELLSKPEPCFDCEAHKQNSKQMLRLNKWLQEHNLGKPGDSVTDTIIEMLEKTVSPKAPTPQLINAERVMNAIHIKPELRGEMTEDRIIENLESLHRDAAGNFTLENKVNMVKKDPELHDLITHLPDFHNAVRVRYDIAHSCGDEDEVSYWRRQLDVVNKLLELTQ